MGGIAHLLNKRATITRKSVATNDGPHPTVTTPTVASNVPCRVVQLSGKELGQPAEVGVLTHRLFFGYGQDIKGRDIVTVDSKRYEIETDNPDPGSRAHHVEVLAKEVRSG